MALALRARVVDFKGATAAVMTSTRGKRAAAGIGAGLQATEKTAGPASGDERGPGYRLGRRHDRAGALSSSGQAARQSSRVQ
jgi:hypothetical protein